MKVIIKAMFNYQNTIFMKIAMVLKFLSIAIVLFGSNVHAEEVHRQKLTQFGDPTTLPKTRTTCVKYVSTKVPYCKTKGFSITCGTDTLKTCSGWKTEHKNLQKEIFYVVHGPSKALDNAVKKSVKSCTSKSTEFSIGVAVAVYAKTSSVKAASTAALKMGAPFFKACITAEIGNKLTFNLGTEENSFWTKWK